MRSNILQRFLNLGQLFLFIVLKWQLVITPSLVMLACVEVFKTSVLQLAVPRNKSILSNYSFLCKYIVLKAT